MSAQTGLLRTTLTLDNRTLPTNNSFVSGALLLRILDALFVFWLVLKVRHNTAHLVNIYSNPVHQKTSNKIYEFYLRSQKYIFDSS